MQMKLVLRRFVLLILALFTLTSVFSQADVTPVSTNGWHLKDAAESGFQGISLDKAYAFLKGKKSKTTVVAVIDSGIDTLHEDLKNVLWVNPKEIPGNGIDDDKNGYIDDVHGWNFIGGKDGKSVTVDSYERDRVYHNYKEKFEGKDIDPSTLSKEEKDEYKWWSKAKEEMEQDEEEGVDIERLQFAYQSFSRIDSILQIAMGKEVFTGNQLDSLETDDEKVLQAKTAFVGLMKSNDLMESTNAEFMGEFKEYLDSEQRKADAKENPPVPYRDEIVKDNYMDIHDRFYGNNNLLVDNKSATHGTHVAGIIGADRKNKIGVDGVADNVRIMAVRTVPDGDEHDKDVALAIRYAVDNGAQVINMSFGKYFSPEKKWVDEAVAYAQSKGVLIVSAAGNEAFNADEKIHYPSRNLDNGKTVTNWICVGASSDLTFPQMSPEGKPYSSLVAGFSNYGKKDVDVFAPGMKIYATLPGGNTYGNLQGTSMASPVVAGLAALILSYFPDLSAEQVKYAIENSVSKPLDTFVIKPGTDEPVKLDELCKSGGIINAYDAVKLASTLKGERKAGNQLKPF